MSNKILIPYVIFDATENGSAIEYGSAPEDELYSCLINEIKKYMEIHEFAYEDEYEHAYDVDLTCDECECKVISNKYISVTGDSKLCRACSPSVNINKDIFNRFMKFLEDNDEFCTIIYFKDNEWIKFTVL